MTVQEKHHANKEPQIKTPWLPYFVGFILSMLVIFLWWSLNVQGNKEQRYSVEAEANKLAGYIKADMRSRIPSLERMVNRWEMRKGIPEYEFINEARVYIADQPGFKGLGWVDNSFRLQWYVSGNGTSFERIQSIIISQHSDLVASAFQQDLITNSPLVELPAKRKGFFTYLPLFADGNFDGYIVAIFDIQEWLDYVFSIKESPEEFENFRAKVLIENVPVYQQKGWELTSTEGKSLEVAVESNIGDRLFTLVCRPTSLFISQNSTVLYDIVFAGGLLLSVLVAFIIFLFQKATLETWRTYIAKNSLEVTNLELKMTRDELQQINSRLNLATNAGNIGIWVWDISTNKLTWNSIMHRIYDIPPDARLSYKTWQQGVHPEDIKDVEKLMEDAAAGNSTFDTEYRIVHRSGEIRYIKSAARVERNAEGNALRMNGVNWDITDQKKAEIKIRHLATHDALTDLPSLRLAKDRLLMAIELSHRSKMKVAVLFIDLDGFKEVNDNHGHDAGDAVLREIAHRLLSCVRESDTVARIGGDEFLITLTELHSHKDASQIAEKIIELVALPFHYRGIQLKVGVSIGIALHPENGEDVESLIKKADEAMYLTKKSGKNGYRLALGDISN